MASASGPTFLKEAALKDAANGAAIKLGYAMGMKKEQLEVVLAFLSGNDVFSVLPRDLGKVSVMHVCLLLLSCWERLKRGLLWW